MKTKNQQWQPAQQAQNKYSQSLQIKIIEITTILLKILRKHVRDQKIIKKLATHSPDRSSDVKVVFLPNASESEVTPASPILLPDDRKGSSEDKNLQSLQIKTMKITTILLKILRKHACRHKSNKRACYALTRQVK